MLSALGKGRLSSCVVSSEMSLWGSALKAAVVDPHSVVEKKSPKRRTKKERKFKERNQRGLVCAATFSQEDQWKIHKDATFGIEGHLCSASATNIAANWEMYFFFLKQNGWDGHSPFGPSSIFFAIKVQTPATPTQGRSAGAKVTSSELCPIGQTHCDECMEIRRNHENTKNSSNLPRWIETRGKLQKGQYLFAKPSRWSVAIGLPGSDFERLGGRCGCCFRHIELPNFCFVKNGSLLLWLSISSSFVRQKPQRPEVWSFDHSLNQFQPFEQWHFQDWNFRLDLFAFVCIRSPRWSRKERKA